ncbi:hypothetical protein WMO13_03660 [Ignatzschineria larvae DSM 13226]|uniref:Uncharacterized protein n=1 Tax=Ignatzschineria larvae DSM 13226 TaxID=1111732 RepID=A0ABZ3C1Y5_9GAMM|nr:hypothetical protein [Ignatzschineria larvae]
MIQGKKVGVSPGRMISLLSQSRAGSCGISSYDNRECYYFVLTGNQFRDR